MSGGRPPLSECVECKGKFGGALWGSVCELCGLQRQLRGHLLSSRFPAEEGGSAVRLLRECLHRVLEHSDTFWGAQSPSEATPSGGKKKKEVKSERREGDPQFIAVKEEPCEKVDKRPLEAPEDRKPGSEASSVSPSPPPGVTGKAPPAKPPSAGSRRESRETPRREERIESPVKVVKEKKHKRKRKSRSPNSRSGSRERRRRRRAERSSEAHRPGLGEVEAEETRKKAKPSRVPPSSAREGAAPRSPSYPPPVDQHRRGYYQEPYWKGPIPAAQGGESFRRDSPRRINKGVKKRQQQEKARTFGWKFQDGRRWR